MSEMKPKHFCRSCKRDFASLRGFDAHRVGRHAFSFNEGWEMDPPREDGRRCLGVDELAGAGLSLGADGFWRDEELARLARERFRGEPPALAEAA